MRSGFDGHTVFLIVHNPGLVVDSYAFKDEDENVDETNC